MEGTTAKEAFLNALQRTATHCNTRWCKFTAQYETAGGHSGEVSLSERTATHYNTLQHTATHCNTLQHTATSVTAI